MLKLFKVFCIIAVLVLFSREGFCDVVDSGDEVIPVRLKVGLITEAEFPDLIANVTKSVSSEVLQIETLANKMFLLALKEFNSDLHLVTQDNISYCLRLIMDDAAPATKVKIKKRFEGKIAAQNGQIANTVDLIKVLIEGKQPQGASNLEVSNYEIFNNGNFRILADRVYDLGGGAKAFVLTFENLMDAPIVLPIEHIDIPGLLAISVDNQTLDKRPRGQDKSNLGYTTKAYMVIGG